MKYSLLLCIVLFGTLHTFSQKQLQFMNQRFEFNAVRNGQPVRLENKDYGLNINYETGEFIAKINLSESRLFSDEDVEYRVPGDEYLEISGTIPINEILDNTNQTQKLQLELNVKHLGTDIPVVFLFDITRIESTSRGFSMFNVSGTIDLRDFGAVDLKGYEPLVDIILNFQLVMLGG